MVLCFLVCAEFALLSHTPNRALRLCHSLIAARHIALTHLRSPLTLKNSPMSPFHYSSISEISALFRAKQISPLELLESHLDRIASLGPKLKAFVYLDADAARAAAKSAAQQIVKNEPLGPLHGIPVTVKSCIEVAGWPVPVGSLLRKNETPSRSADARCA